MRVVEFAGLAPVSFAGMMFADLGAEVLRIERAQAPAVSAGVPRLDILLRGRVRHELDLKSGEGREVAMGLLAAADVLIEGNRPGVMERLNLGPKECAATNPRLIYVRLTGWGPNQAQAGHDINYLALAGALYPLGPADRPPLPPLNFVGNFGGGGMLAVVGALAAIAERTRTGRGSLVDVAMSDGIGIQMALLFSWRAMGFWDDRRGQNLLDGGAYFYRCYECADGGFMAVGAIEPPFHDTFIRRLALDPADFMPQFDRSQWESRTARIAAVFRTRPRTAWEAVFQGADACVTPVLSPEEATRYPSNLARGAHLVVEGQPQPTPAPRFSRMPEG